MSGPHFDQDWDAGDMGCGELVLALRSRLKSMRDREVIRVRATDAGAPHDIPAWCRMTGETLLDQDHDRGFYWIQRSGR